MRIVNTEQSIRQIVRGSVKAYANGFEARHLGQLDNPDGVINMKIHNVFVATLGEEIRYYMALVRSFDSSLGNMLEGMAISIAELFYEVHKRIEGPLYPEQTRIIAELLEAYKNRNNPLTPDISHYQRLRQVKKPDNPPSKPHDSDYYLIDRETNRHYLIELKIGGDLDNKKSALRKRSLI